MTDALHLPWETEPATFADALRAHAVKLATIRAEVAAREADIKAKRAAFDATITLELNTLAGLRRELEATESAVRGMALVEHDTTGNKKPCPGIEVVTRKEYDVDESLALTWAKATGMCLVPESVDFKALQKIAAAAPLPFVTVRDVPSVRIASDLLAALDKEPA